MAWNALFGATNGDTETSADKTRNPDTVAAILDSLDEGVLTLSDDGTIIGINQAACDILEVRRESALHCGCLKLLGEGVCSQSSRVRQSIAERQPIHDLEAEIHTASGRQKMLNIRTTVLRRPDGAAQGGVIVFRDVTELDRLRRDLHERYRLHNLIAKSKPMRDVFELIEQVADTDATVLVEGETGTGKELAARAIHHLSPRAAGPFIAVNCSALPESLLESELFGHVRGAFTGATRDKLGRFEAAAGGTIFLDEIGDISLTIQVKLLRVLQERTVERVGDEKPIPVDIRVISATNRPLAELVRAGSFRQDLLYRLRVIPVHLPPLRARRDDIPLLAQHFVDRFRERTGRPIEGFSAAASAVLLDYAWPGNVRELENVVEYAFVKTRQGRITSAHLPPELLGAVAGEWRPAARSGPGSLPAAAETLAAGVGTSAGAGGGDAATPDAGGRGALGAGGPAAAAARDAAHLRQVLAETGWNISRAARRLKISRTTLYKRIRDHGLAPPADPG